MTNAFVCGLQLEDKRGDDMFLGEYNHTLDAKGRIIMPSRFRDKLGQTFIITKGLDSCLFAYTLGEWDDFNLKIRDLPVSDKGGRRFARFFFSGAAECESDAQGRVIIPQNLREYAGLNKSVVSIGVSNRVEIWSKENWISYNSDANFIDNDLADRMALLGI